MTYEEYLRACSFLATKKENQGKDCTDCPGRIRSIRRRLPETHKAYTKENLFRREN